MTSMGNRMYKAGFTLSLPPSSSAHGLGAARDLYILDEAAEAQLLLEEDGVDVENMLTIQSYDPDAGFDDGRVCELSPLGADLEAD